MLTRLRSTVRTEQFIEQTERLAEKYDRAQEIIDGMVWELERNPDLGTLIPEIDVYQARLAYPPVLAIYSVHKRFVCMLTILDA